MKNRFDRHPYLIVSILFLGMALFGIFFSDWGEERIAFLLLLYLIVAIGIRIDDVVRILEDRSDYEVELQALRSEIVQLRRLVAAIAPCSETIPVPEASTSDEADTKKEVSVPPRTA